MIQRLKTKSKPAQWASNESGTALIHAMVMVAVLGILGVTVSNTAIFESKDAHKQLHRTQALYLAEAGIVHAWDEFHSGASDLSTLLKGADGIADTADDGIFSFGQTLSMGNGYCDIQIVDNDDGDGDTSRDSDYTAMIVSEGHIPATETKRTLKTYALVYPPPSLMDVRGAVSAAGPIQTLGRLVIDGRDHDRDGNLIPNSGVFGVSTLSSYTRGGASKVGGTDLATIDYRPTKPPDAAIIDDWADWAALGGFPTTPDEVVQFEEGWCKNIATSGIRGSQYATDLADVSFPLSGVTYIEPPAGGVVSDIDFLSDSEGILIIHNGATDAYLKNLNYGTFRGLIITDDIIHIHATIIGAVVVLTPAPSGGNCLGNGSGEVLYSSATVLDVTQNSIGVSAIKQSWFC